MTTRVPDEEVTPELQALWSLRNDVRIAESEASRADCDSRRKFELARAAALHKAVQFAEEAARVARLARIQCDYAAAARHAKAKTATVHPTSAEGTS